MIKRNEINKRKTYLENLKKRLKEKGKKICIFPMGVGGKGMLTKLNSVGIDIDFFCDNDSKLWGSIYCGKKCISKDDLVEQARDVIVIIASTVYFREIKESLANDGIVDVERVYFEKIYAEEYVERTIDIEEKIAEVKDICEDEASKEVFNYITDAWFCESLSDNYYERIQEKDQYFDKGIIKLTEDEVFVDVGAYTGDTTSAFIDHCQGRFEKIHLFELDPKIYRKLLDNISGLQARGRGLLQCYPYGLSDKCEIVHFKSGDSNSTIVTDTEGVECRNSTIIADGEVETAKTVTLDKMLDGERVTFIKMDIEGAEQAALRGAENTIKKWHPKLAICIYHSPEDTIEIPLWIKHLVPEYKIYLRHYTNDIYETVCYAVID